MHDSAAAYQVGGMREAIIQFKINLQRMVGISNVCTMIGSQSKHLHLNTLPISHFITLDYDMKKREELTTKRWTENSIYSGRLISTQ
jgi:hypothetical protein